jgi:hypothetical protein
MSKYLFVYHAPTSPADAMPLDPAEAEAATAQWMAWAGRVGEGLVDFGSPVIGGVAVNAEGSTSPSTREVGGYSIVQADDKDAAVALTKGHPHLDTPGATIEVHEFLPVPGM